METRPYVAWDMINNFMIDVFKAYGVPEEDARICAVVLLESDRRGIAYTLCLLVPHSKDLIIPRGVSKSSLSACQLAQYITIFRRNIDHNSTFLSEFFLHEFIIAQKREKINMIHTICNIYQHRRTGLAYST